VTRRKFVPHDYQTPIIAHQLDVKRGATWAGMGTGKTVSTLSSIDALHLAGDLTKPVLVLAPLRVAQSTWPDEVAKWEHLSGFEIVPIVGDQATRRAALKRVLGGSVPAATINYDNIVWLLDTLSDLGVKDWPFDLVVADESTKLKSFRTRQGGKRAHALGKVAHLSNRWLNLTGTPAGNGLKDLWGQTWFLDGGERLGRHFSAFENRWFKRGYDGFSLEPLPSAQEQIQDRLRDICLTVEGLPVDEPIRNVVRVNLPGKAMGHYKEMEKQMYTEIGGHEIEANLAVTRTMKCLQLANGAVYTDDKGAWQEVHDAKIQALESVIEEAAGAPVLVAYHFKSDLARLQRAFSKSRVLDSNPATIREWSAGKIPILLAHPASAGHGLNLQDGGNILVFFSLNWNLEEHEQIKERIGPMRQKQSGYNRPVFEHYLVAADTVDEVVLERLANKRTVQDVLREAMTRKGY
jgi:SNF2 family DNA or RNA helicase